MLSPYAAQRFPGGRAPEKKYVEYELDDCVEARDLAGNWYLAVATAAEGDAQLFVSTDRRCRRSAAAPSLPLLLAPLLLLTRTTRSTSSGGTPPGTSGWTLPSSSAASAP